VRQAGRGTGGCDFWAPDGRGELRGRNGRHADLRGEETLISKRGAVTGGAMSLDKKKKPMIMVWEKEEQKTDSR